MERAFATVSFVEREKLQSMTLSVKRERMISYLCKALLQSMNFLSTTQVTVVSSNDIVDDPEAVLTKLCSEMKIEFTKAMLSWEKGRPTRSCVIDPPFASLLFLFHSANSLCTYPTVQTAWLSMKSVLSRIKICNSCGENCHTIRRHLFATDREVSKHWFRAFCFEPEGYVKQWEDTKWAKWQEEVCL